MKGLLIYQQLEIRLEVEGENFHQGDQLACSISVKNRGSSPQKIENFGLNLSRGDLKKVKAKAEDAFEKIAGAEVAEVGTLDAGAEFKSAWTFELDRNCIITDKAQSLSLVFGLLNNPEGQRHLQLPVNPHKDIEGILFICETSYQFVPKGSRSKSGWVLAKLKPPGGSRFTTVDELELGFRFEDGKLHLKYNFKVQRLSATPSTLAVQKKSVNVEQLLSERDYKIVSEFVESKLIEPKLEEAFQALSAKS